MIGTIAAPTEPPTSSPPSRASRKNSAPRSLTRRTRSGSRSRISSAASAAAAAGGRHPDREHKARRHQLQIVDQLGPPGNIAAARDQALAQRPHPDVDFARIDAEMVSDAKAARPQHPQRMRLVDHQPGAMAARDGDKGRQIGDVAVHAVMAFDDQQRMPVARARLAEQPVGGFVVEMGERYAAAPRTGSRPWTMLLWISASWTMTSSRPSRCPMTVTLVEWPPTKTTLSSAPCSRASARSSSR